MRRKIGKLKLILIRYLVDIYCKFFANDNRNKVALVSCYKWKNKVLEDIKLKYYLSKIHIKADIIAWEEKIDYTRYDAIIIRSVWGFEYEDFRKWLKNVSKKVKIINRYDLINNNFSKNNQFEILDKYDIPHIPTKCIKNSNDIMQNIQNIWDLNYHDYDKLVVKPDISESGENTFILTELINIQKSIKPEELKFKFPNQNMSLLIQPYIEEIQNGEFSIILFNKKISHAVIRYPGVFTSSYSITEIEFNDIPSEIIQITKKIINLDEFNGFAYIRLDFIKKDKNYLILEIELIDPLLFINSIKSKKKQIRAYEMFSNEIKHQLNL